MNGHGPVVMLLIQWLPAIAFIIVAFVWAAWRVIIQRKRLVADDDE